MSKRYRHTFGSALIIAIVLTVAAGAWSTRHTTTTSRADAWAAVHAATMPKTLDGFAAFPIAYRWAALQHLTPAERSALWREQLQRLATDPTLTPEQARFVVEFSRVLTPEVYGTYPDGQEPAAVRAAHGFCQAVPSLNFSETQKRALRELGYGGTTLRAHSLESLKVAFIETLQRAITLRANSSSTPPSCNCNVSNPCGETCVNTGCNPYPFCGCGGFSSCDGQSGQIM
jgi:hypothetical protein